MVGPRAVEEGHRLLLHAERGETAAEGDNHGRAGVDELGLVTIQVDLEGDASLLEWRPRQEVAPGFFDSGGSRDLEQARFEHCREDVGVDCERRDFILGEAVVRDAAVVDTDDSAIIVGIGRHCRKLLRRDRARVDGRVVAAASAAVSRAVREQGAGCRGQGCCFEESAARDRIALLRFLFSAHLDLSSPMNEYYPPVVLTATGDDPQCARERRLLIEQEDPE